MSINIVIDNKYVITSDQFQFILQEKKVAKSGKHTGKEWLDTVGFYPTVSKLVSGLVFHSILTGEADSLAKIGEQVERIGQQCLNAFSTAGNGK